MSVVHQVLPMGYRYAPAIPTDVVLYVRGDGADGSTTIIDSSSYGRTLAAYSGASISTDQGRYGSSSIAFPGTAGGRVAAAVSSDFDFGSGDMTIATWVWIDAHSPPDSVDGARGAVIANTWLNGSGLAGLRGWTFSVIGDTTTTGTALALDTWDPSGSGNATLFRAAVSVSHSAWHHVQACVHEGVRHLFLDGSLLSSSSITLGAGYTAANSGGGEINIGCGIHPQYPSPLNGYLNELLVIKGRALNTASFTPPTEPYFP